MAVQYNISAVDIIKMFGCIEPVKGDIWMEKLPIMLDEFLRLAKEQPLFETSDIWTGEPYFSYEDIEERIEDDKEYWEESPDECQDDEYYQFSKIPRERWKEHVANYLQIGSDYASGVVNFGICETDLEKEDPPVYYWNEANSIKDWRVLTNTLSAFLGGIVCDILAGVNYSTAQDILEEDCWEFCEYENLDQLAQRQIVLSEMTKYPSFYGEDAFYRVCIEADRRALYLVSDDKSLLVIQKA